MCILHVLQYGAMCTCIKCVYLRCPCTFAPRITAPAQSSSTKHSFLQRALGTTLHPVSVRRFPSLRTQPLENLSVDSVTNGFLSNPAPGENIISGNLVMETGCTFSIRRNQHDAACRCTPNLPTNIVDLTGFDSSIILI